MMGSGDGRLRICTLCEATCGLVVAVRGDEVVGVCGDEHDPFSRGYLCIKAQALGAVAADPDRIRKPMRRDGSKWTEIPWDQAFEEIAERLVDLQADADPDAVALYLGNPTVFDYATILYAKFLGKGLGTANLYSTSSLDGLPHLVCSSLMFGHQLMLPVPDLDRTDLLVVIGANPIVSNGSVMTAPGVRRRLAGIRRRGGQIVVIDPRRTETAMVADQHIFIRPGTDPVLLTALLHVLLRDFRLRADIDGVVSRADLDRLRQLAALTDEATASKLTGVPAETIRGLASRLALAPTAVCYGRVGVAHQQFSVLTCWLINILNLVTGNLDRAGGAMFTRPAVDVVALARCTGDRGRFGRPTRVRGLPSFGGERPVAALADEILTTGTGQIKVLVTVGANPVLSAPNGSRVDRALAALKLFVAVDPYLNETTRHAHYILPPAPTLARDQYPVVTSLVSVRNIVKYTLPVRPLARDERAEWQVLHDLLLRLTRKRGARAVTQLVVATLVRWMGPDRLLDLALRIGPYGFARSPRRRLSLARLRRHPHGLDLGPLVPMLRRRHVQMIVIPEPIPSEMARLRSTIESRQDDGADGGLLLVGRRQRRSSNSWLHNLPALASSREGATLLMHPEDASSRRIEDGAVVRIRSQTGVVETVVALTTDIMQGVVSLPHGWGHNLAGSRLSVASLQAGVSLNALTDDRSIDQVSGTAHLSGVRVSVELVSRRADRPEE